MLFLEAKWDVSCDTCLHLCAVDIMLVVAVGQSWISLDGRLKVLQCLNESVCLARENEDFGVCTA